MSKTKEKYTDFCQKLSEIFGTYANAVIVQDPMIDMVFGAFAPPPQPSHIAIEMKDSETAHRVSAALLGQLSAKYEDIDVLIRPQVTLDDENDYGTARAYSVIQASDIDGNHLTHPNDRVHNNYVTIETSFIEAIGEHVLLALIEENKHALQLLAHRNPDQSQSK